MTYNCAVCNLTNKNNRPHVMCCKCYEIFHFDNCAKVYEKFSKLCVFKAKLNYGDDFDANFQELEKNVEKAINKVKPENYKNYFKYAYNLKEEYELKRKLSTRRRKLKIYK